jgi:hypothetical protein
MNERRRSHRVRIPATAETCFAGALITILEDRVLAASKERVLGSIVRALTPYLGMTMAAASARGVCEKLGLNRHKLEPGEVKQLLDALAPGLNVFVGRDRAGLVVREIWKELEALDGGN